MDRMGTMLNDSEVAWCMGFFRSIRNRGTMIIPPPRPLSETTVPAKMPTNVGSKMVFWFLAVGEMYVGLSLSSTFVLLGLLIFWALDLPKIMFPMLSRRKPRKTVWNRCLLYQSPCVIAYDIAKELRAPGIPI